MRQQVYVRDLVVYPIKGCAGIHIQRAVVGLRGLEVGSVADRRFMLVDNDGMFLSQRRVAKMATVRTYLRGDHFVVSSQYMDKPFTVKGTGGPRTIIVQVWKDKCEAFDMGDQAAAWFEKALGLQCRLVYMPDTIMRRAKPERVPGEHYVSFADAYPFLLTSEPSLADLNTRLSSPIPMNRFRPNIVVNGPGLRPYDEEQWVRIHAPHVSFDAIESCVRCQVPTVDQGTGIEDPEGEVRKVLTRYHANDKGLPIFGMNVVATSRTEDSTLSVGDALLPWTIEDLK